jgi:hypothetical protein
MAANPDARNEQELMAGGVLDVWYAAYGAAMPDDYDDTTDGRLTWNELTLTIAGTGGTFRIVHNRLGGEQTSALDFDATAQEIEDALEALTCVGTGGVEVSGAGPFTIKGLGANKDDANFDFVLDTALLTGGGATLTRVWNYVGNKKDGVQITLNGETAEAMVDEFSGPDASTIIRDGFTVAVQSATKRAEIWRLARGLTSSHVTTQAAGASQVGYREIKLPEKPRQQTYIAMAVYSSVDSLYWVAKGHKMAAVLSDATVNSTKGAADEGRIPISYTTVVDHTRAAGDRLASLRQQTAAPSS